MLASALGADAVSAAPAGLGAAIAASSLAGVTAGSGTAFTLFNLVTMTKLKAGIVGAILFRLGCRCSSFSDGYFGGDFLLCLPVCGFRFGFARVGFS